MPQHARDRLTRLLAGAESTKADSAVLELPAEALEVTVAGLGRVAAPIRAAQAKRLIEVSRPAAFGRGEDTLRDPAVRDTWEITPDQVGLGGPDWHADLASALEHFRDELGLPEGARLEAELHSMLVYGRGQFFLPHQDSEKQPGMVATLVVMLPSVHTGGELVVDDGGHSVTYRGSRDNLVLVAFYADRRHEVRPVRSGHRVTLTFNLTAASSDITAPPAPVTQAAAYLREHFATPTNRLHARESVDPTRLAFLLDHEYTRAGLRAGRLKGLDAERVATLRAAAEQAECELVLALAEIKETWDALPAAGSWRGGWYDEDDFDHQDDESGDDHELNELIEDELVLGWWCDPDGTRAETIQLPLEAHETCAVTPTSSLTPYASEYEGYMGNYGNTVDRWYRRAAVLVWPKESSFAVRAEASSAWALRAIQDRIDAGDLVGARADAASVEPFWGRLGADLLAPTLRVATSLRSAPSARVLAEPFRLEMLTTEHAPLLAGLAREYGDPWVVDLLGAWVSSHRFTGQDRLAWIVATLVPLCQALREDDAAPVAAGCAALMWRDLSTRITLWAAHAHPERRRTQLGELAEPVAQVLEAVSDDLVDVIAEVLGGLEDNVVDLLVPVLQALRPATPLSPSLVALVERCRGRLTGLVDRPMRAGNDWSIAWRGCGCGVCDRLAEFLSSRTARVLEWPLAKPGRHHAHQQIDGADLPVRHVTRRQGRPYTLVLTKTEDVFARDEEVRRIARRDLAWLTSAFGA